MPHNADSHALAAILSLVRGSQSEAIAEMEHALR